MKAHHTVRTLSNAVFPHEPSLYRLLFSGGPWDGYETESQSLPHKLLELPCGPQGCSTRVDRRCIPRRARYELRSVTLQPGGLTLIVQYRFEYCGTATTGEEGPRWWHRTIDAFWRWLEPGPRNLPRPYRSDFHVQS